MARRGKFISATVKKIKKQACYCYYCFRPMIEPSNVRGHLPINAKTIGHFIPLTKCGTNFQYNIVICCCQCNSLKADNLPGEFNTKVSQLWQRQDHYKYSKQELRNIINQIKKIRTGYDENMKANKPYYLIELPFKKGILQTLREKFKTYEVPSCNNQYRQTAEC